MALDKADRDVSARCSGGATCTKAVRAKSLWRNANPRLGLRHQFPGPAVGHGASQVVLFPTTGGHSPENGVRWGMLAGDQEPLENPDRTEVAVFWRAGNHQLIAISELEVLPFQELDGDVRFAE